MGMFESDMFTSNTGREAVQISANEWWESGYEYGIRKGCEIVSEVYEKYVRDWIPVDSKLPEADIKDGCKRVRCLVTVKWETKKTVKPVYRVKHDQGWRWEGMKNQDYVIAWMKMPEAY